MTDLDRRSFLATLGGVAIGVIGCSATSRAAMVSSPSRRKLSSVGIQLYTMRTQARADLAGTLQKIAQLGYKEVEFWGNYPLTPTQIRAALDANGLTSPSMHIGIPRDASGWTPIFDSAHAMGQQYIVAASPPFNPKTMDDWTRLAAAFNDAGRRVKDAGFRFAFHNHTDGMKKDASGVLPYDVLLAETDPELVSYELDIHWAYAGGSDAIELLNRYPTRIRMVHVKDSAGAPDFKQTDVGAGTYPWAKIFDAANRAGIEHYFVESDTATDSVVFAKNSIDYLNGLTF
jgi:sugar phosphate isomerase/epimerase